MSVRMHGVARPLSAMVVHDAVAGHVWPVRRLRVALLAGAWATAWALGAAAGLPLDINTASLAQIEALGGVGTALAARVIEERSKRPFADWSDAQKRIKGLGPKLASQLSEQGLTVNGTPYQPTPP